MNTQITEVDINGVKYIPKDSIDQLSPKLNGMQCVLIRSYAAGVHFGYLHKEEFTPSGKVVTLIKTRRIWYWDGAASCSQIALEGVSKPGNCKFSVELESNEIVNVIETIPLTDKAKDNLYKVAVWKS